MDPVKVIILVAAFLLLLLLGRKLSGAGEVQAYHPSDALPPQPGQAPSSIEDALGSSRSPALVGSELPFPVQLPELTVDDDGRYNRQEFINYYFEEIDLVQGPPDPAAFADEFSMETRNPEDGFTYTHRFLVATPAGLQRSMKTRHLPSLYLRKQAVIVPRWDLKLILEAVVQEIISLHGEYSSLRAGEHAVPDNDESKQI